jgi:membrane associated rhomboid family serine protease
MMILLVVLVIGGYALYSMTPDERTRMKERLVALTLRARDESARRRAEPEPFRDALRERTPRPLVMPALVAINLVGFLLLGWGGTPEALIGAGGSFGPRTTNGEWWRLVVSMFVHANTLQFLISMIALVQLGLVLERLVGHVTFAATYLSTGVLASLVMLSEQPMAVSTGSTGAIFGLYGLLLAASVWTSLLKPAAAAVPAETEPPSHGLFGLRDVNDDQPHVPVEPTGEATGTASSVAMTLAAAKQIAPVAGLFTLFSLIDGGLAASAEIAGLSAGFICGVVVSKGVGVHTPPVPRVAVTMAVTAVVAVASAVPLRGLADVRPEISRVIAIEKQTVSVYERSVKQFQLGTLTAPALARVIEQSIAPEFQTMQARLKALGRIPPEHQALVAGAEEYLRLRDESWRLRAAALNRSNMGGLRKADAAERLSLAAYEKIQQQ